MSAFQAERRVFSAVQTYQAPPAVVFPLLCPVREYDWIPDWDCEIVYTDSGVAELGCVFRTPASTTRIDGAGEEVWMVSRYTPAEAIEFVKFAADLYVVKYDIALTADGQDATRSTWTQTVTGLSEQGNRMVRARSADNYAVVMQALETRMNHFLATGSALPPDG
jgi:hypothetical protein